MGNGATTQESLKPRRRRRQRVSVSGIYARMLADECDASGLKPDRAMQRIMDRAATASRDEVLNRINGVLNQIGMSLANLKVDTRRDNIPAQANIRELENGLKLLPGLIAALP